MAAWGLIRFVCQRCGERFWTRVTDQFTIDPGRAVCYECKHPLMPERAPLAFRAETSDTTAQQPHE